MSLFNTLLNLQLKNSNKPSEDYLTELFTYTLVSNDEIMLDFLKTFKVKHGKITEYYIHTQYRYSKLKGHSTDSAVDMAVFMNQHTILIENKIDSDEGHKQLQRYAEHLNQQIGRKTLIYITRDYDPKDENIIFENCKNDIQFIPLRWYQIFRLLQPYASGNLVINEILIFMKKKGLSSNKQFTPLDLLALTNFERVRRMLDQSMRGKASGTFEELMGGISQHSASMTQIRDNDRYVYIKHKGNRIQILQGYWLNAFSLADYPHVALVVEVAPNSKKKAEIREIFRAIAADKTNKWIDFTTDDAKSWSSIQIIQTLNYFLHGDDHIQAIENFFLDCLKEFKNIKPRLDPYL